MKTAFKSCIFLLLLITSFTACEKDVDPPNLIPPTADAGPSQNINLPATSDTLVGSAVSHNGPIKGYLWSLISGPNIPIIHSPSSINSRVSGLILGLYKFQLLVVDSAGLTGVDTTSILVSPNPNPIQTLTAQPANNANEALLTWTNSGVTTGANFSFQEIPAGAWTTGGELFIMRSIFKFDMSAIPANATIISAKLSLYSTPNPQNGNSVDANFGNNNSMFIERVTSNWSSSLTWPNQPFGDNATQISIPHTNLASLDLTDIDVTGLVAAMVAGNNYGFKIRLQNEAFYNIRNFCSSKHATQSKRPKLVITYQ